ncbi:hypothetical protein CHS0354_039063 [Potamilus streckersoni]|uniref:C-type lectin domain-containing protein n=1 Tax=Potamilus streckersoni TaxID=2493646 RepID=A0AAE0VHD9_9BIVA|nr:hypothetical protein CHS0354_039063 [Potamilus streckersoni]
MLCSSYMCVLVCGLMLTIGVDIGVADHVWTGEPGLPGRLDEFANIMSSGFNATNVKIDLLDLRQSKMATDLMTLKTKSSQVIKTLNAVLTNSKAFEQKVLAGIDSIVKTLEEIKYCLGCTCPKGYELYSSVQCGKFCYRFESNNCSSWSAARSVCQADGGDLLVPSECYYQYFREKAQQREGTCSHFWIGGYTNTPGSNYVTVKGNPIPSSFPFWSVGQPDGLGGESCLEMRSYFTNYLMNDYHCDQAQGFICQI